VKEALGTSKQFIVHMDVSTCRKSTANAIQQFRGTYRCRHSGSYWCNKNWNDGIQVYGGNSGPKLGDR